MEISKAIHRYGGPLCRKLCAFLLLISCTVIVSAQAPLKQYKVKDGRMYIELGKKLADASLDSFILQYDLGDLLLKQFIRTNIADSLQKLGWKVEVNNAELAIISKPLAGFGNIGNPAEKIIYTEKHSNNSELFPLVNNRAVYGANRFSNKKPFAVSDSIVTFFLRGNDRASRVVLSGTFSNWSPDLLGMTRTDSGWIAFVKLGPGKHWYKFVVDGNWTIDRDNQINENDGRGNVNSVFYKTNYLLTLDSFVNAKKVYVSGSFNQWRPRELQLNRTANGWELPIYLTEGTYTYRFVVDDKWMADPFNPNKLPNEFNETNSVIRIGKPFIFSLDGYTNAKKVVLAGSFNNWRRDELFMNKTSTGWELPYSLGPGNYEYNFIIDDKWVSRAGTPDNTNNTANLFFIIAPNYVFQLKGFEQAKTVFISGDFNNWSPNNFPMKKEGDTWKISLYLTPGKHLYKFVVDGKWIIDPGNKLWEQNEHRTGNSVIWIER